MSHMEAQTHEGINNNIKSTRMDKDEWIFIK